MQNEPFSPGLKVHPNLKVMTTKGMGKTLVQTQALQIRRHSIPKFEEVLTALSPQVPTLGALP